MYAQNSLKYTFLKDFFLMKSLKKKDMCMTAAHVFLKKKP